MLLELLLLALLFLNAQAQYNFFANKTLALLVVYKGFPVLLTALLEIFIFLSAHPICISIIPKNYMQ